MMKTKMLISTICLSLSMQLLSLTTFAEKSYSPYADQPPSTNVYWGDTHLHSNLSMDSYSRGNKMLSPADAYRFARGEQVTANNGMNVRIRRPLDFLIVADHAEMLGLVRSVDISDPMLLKTDTGKRIFDLMKKNQDDPDFVATRQELGELLRIFHKKDSSYSQFIWNKVTQVAEQYNDPGKFTALIGYEWTARLTPPSYDNLHRVVVFKDGADKADQILPFSSYDSEAPEDLWKFLEGYQQKTGGDVLAIPHNGNGSNGNMFALIDSKGRPLTQSYAKTRSRWEPLVEVTQIKGDSEAHPLLSPNDEFADYETWNGWSNVNLPEVGRVDRKKSEYARSALKLGLNQQAKLGVNPFKFGMIGSTDAHTSLATIDENNFWGKQGEPSSNRLFKTKIEMWPNLQGWKFTASGYAAVWAQENTRESLFSAMKRKEVYATTGPRMTVRFFGGWEYDRDDALKPDLARIGYAKGVPMGGDLTNAPKGKSPSFLIRAIKDPDGANLDRVQVIKGWRDNKGELHEKIYDVVLSDHRKVSWNGKVKSVGSTVNVKEATYLNSIGDSELATVWRDPNFHPDQLAFYYVRVLEIPTPRWTAYDAKFFNLDNIPEAVPIVTQERAYTSPIWYTPKAL